jgi:hypothetical protein
MNGWNEKDCDCAGVRVVVMKSENEKRKEFSRNI